MGHPARQRADSPRANADPASRSADCPFRRHRLTRSMKPKHAGEQPGHPRRLHATPSCRAKRGEWPRSVAGIGSAATRLEHCSNEVQGATTSAARLTPSTRWSCGSARGRRRKVPCRSRRGRGIAARRHSGPPPRYRMPWASITKWVVGAASMICCTHSGMLSRGVMPPESISKGSSTMIISRANCGIVRAKVARNMPSDVAANRCSAAPHRNRGTEPWIGTASRPSHDQLYGDGGG